MIQEFHELFRDLRKMRYSGTELLNCRCRIYLKELEDVSQFIINSETNSSKPHKIMLFNSLKGFCNKYYEKQSIKTMDFEGSYVLLARTMNFFSSMQMEWLIFIFPLDEL